MSAYRTDLTATINPFGDVDVEVDFTVDLATEEIEINDVRIADQYVEWKLIFFQPRTEKEQAQNSLVGFAQYVEQGLLEHAENVIGSFDEAIRETRAESRRESREDR